jgi:hypothetical protein
VQRTALKADTVIKSPRPAQRKNKVSFNPETGLFNPDPKDQSNTQRKPGNKTRGEHRKKALFRVRRALYSIAAKGPK